MHLLKLIPSSLLLILHCPSFLSMWADGVFRWGGGDDCPTQPFSLCFKSFIVYATGQLNISLFSLMTKLRHLEKHQMAGYGFSHISCPLKVASIQVFGIPACLSINVWICGASLLSTKKNEHFFLEFTSSTLKLSPRNAGLLWIH